MKAAMYAIIKKDFRGVANNRRLFFALLIVPLVLTVIFPSIFVITIYFVPDDPAVTKLMSLLPEAVQMESMELTLSSMILNYILPVFFLMIPITTASIMAASAFVGEKERHTLETLLYCPLTLKQIFQAKVWASFLLSMLVSVISFVAMFLVLSLIHIYCTCQRIAICYCTLWLWGYAGNAKPQPKNSADYVSCDF